MSEKYAEFYEESIADLNATISNLEWHINGINIDLEYKAQVLGLIIRKRMERIKLRYCK